MSVLPKLASSLGRRDEQPNVDLAASLASRPDREAIAELADALTGTTRAIESDAIKVLYELGALAPELVAAHADKLFEALHSRNNRLVWGSLAALDAVSRHQANLVEHRLAEILQAAGKASVIGRDKTVSILCNLIDAGLCDRALPALIQMLKTSAVNQLPMYAEQAAGVVSGDGVALLDAVLRDRLKQVEQPSKRKRIERVLSKLGSISQ